jgi:hypothetical protein
MPSCGGPRSMERRRRTRASTPRKGGRQTLTGSAMRTWHGRGRPERARTRSSSWSSGPDLGPVDTPRREVGSRSRARGVIASSAHEREPRELTNPIDLPRLPPVVGEGLLHPRRRRREEVDRSLVDVEQVEPPLLGIGVVMFGEGHPPRQLRGPGDGHALPADPVVANDRFVGSARRDLLDHVMLLGDEQLGSLLREYRDYGSESRPHQGLGQRRPAGGTSDPDVSKPIAFRTVLGGLHVDYRRVRDR